MDGAEQSNRGFNVRGPQRMAKRRAAKESANNDGGDFKVDPEDPRIAKVFTGGDFDIDPTNPEFRPSAGMQAVLRKKRERKVKSAPAESKDDIATIQTARSQDSKSSATTLTEAPRFGSTSRLGSGGLLLFAPKRRAPVGEGQQVAGTSAESSSAQGERKRRQSQDSPDLHVGKPTRRKKRRGASL